MNRVKKVGLLGQQVWLDSLSRQLIESGHLQRLIDEDGIAGLTSNPAIFQQSIANDPAYRTALAELPAALSEAEQRFEALALPDIQAACDLFLPLYEDTASRAGYVSFEVSPRLAQDAAGTVAAAQRLWASIDRPNVMIKIPATSAGLIAIAECIALGINVNVTLMFSQQHVRDVFEAYCSGLAQRARSLQAGQSLPPIRMVASVFISRWDTRLDPQLAGQNPSLCGTVAIALARQAYQTWQARFAPDGPFAESASRGGVAPMLLWASTGCKNPAYRDVMYVESLIGAHTVNTLPEATLNAFRDHGEAAPTLSQDSLRVAAQLEAVAALGMDLDAIGETLQQDGLRLFDKAFADLLEECAR